MTDEEVGELWKRSQDVMTLNEGGSTALVSWVEVARSLIRKLVEERAQVKWRCGMPKKDIHAAALRDFHIDPKTWPKEDS